MPTLPRNPRLLLIRLDRLGDVVLSTPAIHAVRAAHPHAHITLMVSPTCRDAVEGLSAVNNVMTYDKAKQHRSIWRTLRFAWQLRAEHFDAIIVLHPTNRSHWIAWLIGSRIRVGWHRKCGWLLTHRVPHVKQEGEKHEVDYTLDVLKPLGISPVRRRPEFPAHPLAGRQVERWLATRGVALTQELVAIHPSASCVSKRWMPERFACVADALMEREGRSVVIIAGPNDGAVGRAVIGACRASVLNAVGAFSVAELGELLQRCALLISNDSGPVHVAVGVGTPVIDLFGRNQAGLSPLRWGPLGPRDHVIHKDVGCETCLAHRCNIAFKCLTEITVDDVLAAAHTILEE